MIRNTSLSILLFFLIANAIAQVPTVGVNWVQSIRGAASSVHQSMTIDQQGNIYTCGNFWGEQRFDEGIGDYTLDGINDHDAFVAKYNSEGRLIWARVFGGWGNDRATGIAVDELGDVYITGWRTSEVDFDSDPIAEFKVNSGNRGFLLKLNSFGIFQWVKSVSSPTAHNVKVIYQGNGKLFVARSEHVDAYDSNGKLLGTVKTGHGEVYCMTMGKQKEILIGGMNSAGLQQLPAMYFMKMNANGQGEWIRRFSGNNLKVTDIASHPNGDMLLTGIFQLDIDFDPDSGETMLSNINKTIFIARYNSLGRLIWAKQIPVERGAEASSISFDPSGNIFFTGSYKHKMTLNTTQGIQTFESENSSFDAFLMQLNGQGDVEWAASMGDYNNDYVQELEVSSDGKFLYWTGSLNAEFNFDLQGGALNKKALGQVDAFLAQYAISRVTSMQNFKDGKEVSIFPNPSSGLIQLEFSNANYQNYSIRTLDGKLLRSGATNSSSMEIDTQLNPGVYLIELTNDQYERSVHRLVIQK